MAKPWHKKHISTKWGVVILGILILSLLIAIPQLTKTQNLSSRAAIVESNDISDQYKKPKQPVIFTNLFARQDIKCKRWYRGEKLSEKKLEDLPAQANVGDICRDKNGNRLSIANKENKNGIYRVTTFGCSWYKDKNGKIVHWKDKGDNCKPTYGYKDPECKAKGKKGKDCEEEVNFFSANTDQYGPGTLLKVTNPNNGKVVVVRAIDRGPHCSVQDNKSEGDDKAIFDISQAAYLALGQPRTEFVKVERVSSQKLHLGPCAEYWFE